MGAPKSTVDVKLEEWSEHLAVFTIYANLHLLEVGGLPDRQDQAMFAPRTLDVARREAPARFDWAATEPSEAWRREAYSDRALYRDLRDKWQLVQEQRGRVGQWRLAQIREALAAIDARQAAAGLTNTYGFITPSKRSLWERARRLRHRGLAEANEEFSTKGFSCHGTVPPPPVL